MRQHFIENKLGKGAHFLRVHNMVSFWNTVYSWWTRTNVHSVRYLFLWNFNVSFMNDVNHQKVHATQTRNTGQHHITFLRENIHYSAVFQIFNWTFPNTSLWPCPHYTNFQLNLSEATCKTSMSWLELRNGHYNVIERHLSSTYSRNRMSLLSLYQDLRFVSLITE